MSVERTFMLSGLGESVLPGLNGLLRWVYT